MSKSDEELLAAYYQGDDASWDIFQQRWEDKLLAYVIYKRQNVTETGKVLNDREIVNRTLLKAVETKHRETGRFNPEKGSASHWIYRICLNEVRDTARKKRNERNDKVAPEETVGSEAEPEFLVNDFLKDCIQEALEGELRQMTEMKFFDKLDQKTIATAMHMTEPTVSRRFNQKIFPRLKKCLRSKGIQA